MTNNDHRKTAYTMTKKNKRFFCHCVGCPSVIVVCHVVYFVFSHCVGCPSVIVVCHVVHLVFLSLCRLSFCDRCLSCCSFGDSLQNDKKNKWTTWQTTITEGQPTQWQKKQNKQHDKQRLQKDSLHNDQENKINNMTNNDLGCPSVIVVCHVVYFVFLVIV
jgi:hypothetical protein